MIRDRYHLFSSAITEERVQCQRNWRTYWTALLENRAAIGSKLMKLTSTKATELGLKLTFAEVKDRMFPGEMKKVFAQVVEAQKEGQAALEKARGETAVLRNLANAARITDDNPNLLQRRALQAVRTAREIRSSSDCPALPFHWQDRPTSEDLVSRKKKTKSK